MVYESSYESGRAPFLPDPTRGSWAAPGDFIFACLGFAFKIEIYCTVFMYVTNTGIVAAIPYLLHMALYIVPILVIHSFLGQFSSSGFISAFRIAPILKGMGYISLALNIATLTYYSAYASVPLLFFFHSLNPTLPWSCEGLKDWSHTIPEYQQKHLCNITNITAEIVHENDTEYDEFSYNYERYHVPAALYFRTHFAPLALDNDGLNEYAFSWQLICCNLVTWGIIAGIFYKCFQTEKLGTLLRYLVICVIALVIIILVRFLFLPTAMDSLISFWIPQSFSVLEGVPYVSFYVLTAFGSGFGSTITLASFNKFRTNIMDYTWVICVGQMIIFLAFGLMYTMVENELDVLVKNYDNFFIIHEWTLYLSSASAIAEMAWANLWSLLYYGMLTIGALVVLVTQLHCILTSIFDEFATLRKQKTEFTFALIAAVCTCSLFFTCADGLLFEPLVFDGMFVQLSLNLVLLGVVLWIYGRERFQRDIEFMLGQPFATWKVNMLRFVAPLFLIFAMLGVLAGSIFGHLYGSTAIIIISIFLMLLPWIFIPGYSIFVLLQTSGSLSMRFIRCCRPTDWYPIDAEDRQRYEEAMGNMDITHQLYEVTNEIPEA